MESAGDSTNSVNILHVEDNPSDILLTERALEECDTNFRVTPAATGEEALNILRAATGRDGVPPDLILLDLDLPKISGFDLLKFVSEHDRLASVPLIILSGLVYAESLLRDYASLIRGCFNKPDDIEGFMELAKDIEKFGQG